MKKIIHRNIDNIDNIKILICSADLFIHQIINYPFISSKSLIQWKNLISNKKESLQPLGRWNIESCSKKINNKVDLSNEDHCGPCGQYILSKNPTKEF